MFLQDKSKVKTGIIITVLMLVCACSTPEFSALNQYKSASSEQLIAYYICLASSARAEGQQNQAVRFEQLAWQEMQKRLLPDQRVIWVYQQAASQGKQFYFHRASDSCWRWSVKDRN